MKGVGGERVVPGGLADPERDQPPPDTACPAPTGGGGLRCWLRSTAGIEGPRAVQPDASLLTRSCPFPSTSKPSTRGGGVDMGDPCAETSQKSISCGGTT